MITSSGANVTATNAVWDGKRVALFGARGECVSCQLCIENLGKEELSAVQVRPGKLESAAGGRAERFDIELYRNWYARNCLGNMTFQEAVDLAGVLKPRLTVPGHYEMFANNSQDPVAFAGYMRLKYPELRYWIGEHGQVVLLDAYQPKA